MLEIHLETEAISHLLIVYSFAILVLTDVIQGSAHRFIGKCQKYPYHEDGQDAVRNMEMYNLTETQDPMGNIAEKEAQILEQMIQEMPQKDQP